jgi:rhodanese-related sulfurtransferase
MRRRRFIVFDGAGVFCWVSAYLILGYLSSGALITIGSRLRWPGWVWIVVAAGALVAYVVFKQVQRRLVLRKLRVAKISVEELQRRLEAGDAIAVIDLRHPLDFETDPYTIPTATYIPAEELPVRHAEIPRDREVVLYCTCPDEITSAKEALRLRRRGIRRVRPLEGGLAAWRAAGLPVVLRGPVVPVDNRLLNAA